ncbi:MAG: hypothetical protein Kow0029_00080 [Candidatus Rifleibacteriota bacterium]
MNNGIEQKSWSNESAPTSREFFKVRLLGLPLNLADNIKCGLVIILAILLQIRLHHTLLAEGWIALFGFLGYVGMRMWLLSHRYTNPGELTVEEDCLILPASLNNGKEEKIRFADIKLIQVYIFEGRHSNFHSSIVICTRANTFKLNFLAIELDRLEMLLKERGLRIQRQHWDLKKYIIVILLVLFSILLLQLFFNLSGG